MADFILSVGCSGSGKSFVSEMLFPAAAVFNCDDVKATAKKGKGKTASFPGGAPADAAGPDADGAARGAVARVLHSWSKEKNHDNLMAALAAGPGAGDVIYDSTGTNDTTSSIYIDAARAAGFNIIGLFVDVSLDVAVARDVARGLDGDRTLGEKFVSEKYTSIATAATTMKPKTDEFWIIDNNEHIDDVNREKLMAKIDITHPGLDALAGLDDDSWLEDVDDADADFADAVLALSL